MVGTGKSSLSQSPLYCGKISFDVMCTRYLLNRFCIRNENDRKCDLRLRKQIIQSGIGIMIVKVIGTLLAFILSIVLSRSLGPVEYGVYTFSLSVLVLLSIPIQAGFSNLAVRETSKALVNNDYSLIGGIWGWIYRLISIYFLFLSMLLVLLFVSSEELIDTLRFKVFVAGFISIPLLSLIIAQNAIIRGLGKVVVGAIPDSLIRPGINLIFIIGVFLLAPVGGMTSHCVMIVYVVSVVITFLISLLILKKLTSKHVDFNNKRRVESDSWRRTLYPLTIVGAVQLLFGYADIVILGIFRSDMEVGVYKIVIQFSVLVVFGLTVINQMLHPYFSRLYAKGDMVNLQKLVTYSSIVIFALAVLPAMIFMLAGESIIGFVFGKEYVVGKVALNILVAGQLANAAFGSAGALLNMTGHEKKTMKAMLIALAVYIPLNLILVPFLGMEGAALSTAISLILLNSLLRSYVKERLGIESSGLIYSCKLKK